ncbi:MAG TPA: polysaccharide deacetylase family protein [Candidatus Binatia bacterium]|nr:polysaccharide deacetylase family protein [Candidatus Binatia bacterium]
MNERNESSHNRFAVLFLALLLAGCSTTAPTPSDGPRATAESFESDDYFVVIARSGDTAQSLATRFLGDASKGWMIEDFNGVSTLTPGQQIVIPKRYWNLSGVSADGYQLVPVLCYHNLAPQSKGRMILAAKAFEEQMRYLKNQGYRVINLKEFVEFVSLKRQLPRRSVLLTFDDGYRSFLQYALPVLKELGFTATLFIYTDFVGGGANAFTWADLKKLQQEGFDVQAHSKSHGDMLRGANEPAAEYDRRLEAELAQPRALFQKNLGFAPEILAYPYGRQDDAVVRRTRDRGYTAAFTVRRQASPSFVDPYRIHRSQIYPEMSMDDFIKNLDLYSEEEIK